MSRPRATTPAPGAHIGQLDALRALAVAAVVAHHNRIAYFEEDLNYWAGAGVRLFFVLSGFLITGILLRSRVRAERLGGGRRGVLGRFYARRALRIFPLYYLVVGTALLLAVEPARRIAWWLLTYTLNIHMASQGWYEAHFAHFWTLSVEEQFYVGWPWLVLLCPRPYLLRMTAAVALAAPLYRFAYVLSGYTIVTALSTYISTFAALDSLGAGAVLALLRHADPVGASWEPALRRIALPAAGAVLTLALAGVWDDLGLVLHDSAQAVVFVWIIHAGSRATRGVAGALLGWRPLQYVGKISYGIYVYHPFVPGMLAALGAWLGLSVEGAIGFLLSTALALGLASASWHLFERPINDLKRYFEDPPGPVRRP